MKRVVPNHERVFHDSKFANEYIRKHTRMQRKFADEYSDKLKQRNFNVGRILDAGCGFGSTLIEIGRNFEESVLTGIDLSGVLLKHAIENSNEFKLNQRVKFIKADVYEIPFPDKYFDVVINTNMLHVVEYPVKMLNEIERVLGRNGIFFIADIRRSILGVIEKEIKSAFTDEELREITDKSNLRRGEISKNMLWWKYESID